MFPENAACRVFCKMLEFWTWNGQDEMAAGRCPAELQAQVQRSNWIHSLDSLDSLDLSAYLMFNGSLTTTKTEGSWSSFWRELGTPSPKPLAASGSVFQGRLQRTRSCCRSRQARRRLQGVTVGAIAVDILLKLIAPTSCQHFPPVLQIMLPTSAILDFLLFLSSDVGRSQLHLLMWSSLERHELGNLHIYLHLPHSLSLKVGEGKHRSEPLHALNIV